MPWLIPDRKGRLSPSWGNLGSRRRWSQRVCLWFRHCSAALCPSCIFKFTIYILTGKPFAFCTHDFSVHTTTFFKELVDTFGSGISVSSSRCPSIASTMSWRSYFVNDWNWFHVSICLPLWFGTSKRLSSLFWRHLPLRTSAWWSYRSWLLEFVLDKLE